MAFKATESDPRKVELSEIPKAKGLPLREPANKFKFLKIIAIANALQVVSTYFFYSCIRILFF